MDDGLSATPRSITSVSRSFGGGEVISAFRKWFVEPSLVGYHRVAGSGQAVFDRSPLPMAKLTVGRVCDLDGSKSETLGTLA